MKIGLLLNDVISFLIVSMAVFVAIVKLVGYFIRQREKPAEEVPPMTKEEILLTEIRDLLKQQGA